MKVMFVRFGTVIINYLKQNAHNVLGYIFQFNNKIDNLGIIILHTPSVRVQIVHKKA